MSREDVGKMIKSIDNLMMRNANSMDQSPVRKSLSPMQGWIIGYLFMHQEKVLYQKDLEQEFCLPKSTLATILKQLDEKGFILRESAEHDSRLKRIRISQKGMELQYDFLAHIRRVDQYMCEGIPEEEIETFLQTGRKLRKNLENRLSLYSNTLKQKGE